MQCRDLKLLETMIDAAQTAMIVYDSVGRILEWNRQAGMLFEWNRNEVMGRLIFDTILPVRSHAKANQLFPEICSQNNGYFTDSRFDIEAVDKNGESISIEVSILPGSIDEAIVWIASLSRMDKLARVNDELQEMRDRYEIAIKGAGVGIWEWNRKSHVVYLSEKFLHLLGHEASFRIDGWKGIRELIHPDDRRKVIDKLLSHYMNGTPFDVDCRMKTQLEGYCWFHVCGQAVIDGKGRVERIAGSLADVDASYVAESALRDSESKFREAFANAPIGICLIRPDGKFMTVNRKLCEILGYSSTDLSRRSFLDITHPDDIEASSQAIEQLLSGEEESVAFDKRYIRPDGEIVWTHVISSVHRDRDNQPLYYINQIIDISEKVQSARQREQLEAQLRQAQKLETIGTLAGGIAHDFNNILTPIMGFAEIAGLNIPQDSPAQANLDQILRAAHRAKDLVKQIMAFGRLNEQCYRPQSISMIISETVALLRATLPSTIEIKIKCTTENDAVLCDPVQIHQVVMNLCANAYQAMPPDGGEITIELREFMIEPPVARYHPNLKSGNHLLLIISDTGCGMKWETAQRIFEPFFTTKPVGEGTGLGLSVVHGIVIQHGGDIAVYSQPNDGTTFHIFLPLTNRADSSIDAQKDDHDYTGTEHVLFVDDEENVALVGQAMLEMLGYRVTIATSSTEAFEMFQAQPHEYQIVITDQTMPRMSGDRLAVKLLEIRPNLPIVLATGLSESITAEKRRQIGVRGFIMKPFTVNELGYVIRTVLESMPNTAEVHDAKNSCCGR
jgi:PAS domain S-box-containing protein